MAVLSDSDRALVTGQFQAEMSQKRETFAPLTKADIRAATNGLDDFYEANKAAINNAIPQPARGALTTTQKNRLGELVLHRRVEIGS